MPTEMNKFLYSPQISPGNDDVTPMDEDFPLTLISRDTVLFQYPYNTPSLTLTLKTPAFNNQKTINLSRIQRHSRGRSLITYRDPAWPKSYSLSYSFENLSYANKNDIISFIQQTLGKEIKFTDYQSQVYKAIIANPRDFISEERGTCGFTWKVNLQGILM